jgi:hypothetical protein
MRADDNYGSTKIPSITKTYVERLSPESTSRPLPDSTRAETPTSSGAAEG